MSCWSVAARPSSLVVRGALGSWEVLDQWPRRHGAGLQGGETATDDRHESSLGSSRSGWTLIEDLTAKRERERAYCMLVVTNNPMPQMLGEHPVPSNET